MKNEFNPQSVDAINRAAKLIYGADEIINRQVQESLGNVITDIRSERFSIRTQMLLTYDEFFQSEIILASITKYLKLPTFSMQRVDSILNLIGKIPGKKIEFIPGYTAVYDRNVIIIGKIDVNIKGHEIIKNDGTATIDKFRIRVQKINMNEVKFNNNPKIEFLDADKINGDLIFRTWDEGDSFTPMGMEGTMKISDYLINRKVPIIDKNSVMLLADEEDILWVCGYRMSDKCRITDKTKKALKVEFFTI